MIFSYGSIVSLLFLVCIFIYSIIAIVDLRSISDMDVSLQKRNKFKQSRGMVVGILLFSAFGIIVQLFYMYYNKNSESFVSKFEGTEKCESIKCEETLKIN